VIFDNANDPAELRDWLPQGPGQTLVTSRNPGWLEIAASRAVDVFSRTESIKLLRDQVPTLTEIDADTIAMAVGDLPLALAQASGVINSGLSPADYLSALRSEVAELLAAGAPATYPASLAATVHLALKQAYESSPAAGELARMYAFLAAEPIPNNWFTGAAKQTPHALADQLLGATKSPLRLTEAMTVLARHGLIRIVGTGGVMHRLTAAIIRASVNDTQKREYRRGAEAVLLAAHPGDESNPNTWPEWAVLLPHLQELPLDTDDAAVRSLARDAAWSLLNRGQFAAARAYITPLYERWLTTRGPDQESTLFMANALAYSLRHLGDAGASSELNADILARSKRIFGEDHSKTLVAAGNVAIDLREQEEFQAARELREDTLNRQRRILGEDHPDTLRTANNLALNLRMLGEVQLARLLDEDTLARRRRVLGHDHPHTLISAGNLADDLSELGELESAREVYEDTVARMRRVLGDNHPDTLGQAHNLAIDLRALGEVQEARQLGEDTLTRMRRVLGDDHPNTLSTANNLAVDLRALGEVQEARQLDEDTLPRMGRVLGYNHPHTARLKARLKTEGAIPDDREWQSQ
jgi:hypothetical protein